MSHTNNFNHVFITNGAKEHSQVHKFCNILRCTEIRQKHNCSIYASWHICTISSHFTRLTDASWIQIYPNIFSLCINFIKYGREDGKYVLTWKPLGSMCLVGKCSSERNDMDGCQKYPLQIKTINHISGWQL